MSHIEALLADERFRESIALTVREEVRKVGEKLGGQLEALLDGVEDAAQRLDRLIADQKADTQVIRAHVLSLERPSGAAIARVRRELQREVDVFRRVAGRLEAVESKLELVMAKGKEE